MAGAFTVPLIKAGASILGGLLGGKSKGPSLEQQRISMQITEQERFKWLRDGAQAAGFNPLTVLGATGGNMAPQLQNPLNTNAVAQALSSGLTTFANAYDPVRHETQELQNELLREQIDEINNNELRYGAVPQVRTTTSPIETRDGQGQTENPIVDTETAPYEMKPPTTEELELAVTPLAKQPEITNLKTNVVLEDGTVSEQFAGDDIMEVMNNAGRYAYAKLSSPQHWKNDWEALSLQNQRRRDLDNDAFYETFPSKKRKYETIKPSSPFRDNYPLDQRRAPGF